MDIVIAVDGSEHGLDVVRYSAKLARSNPEMKLHLINVQPPCPPPRAASCARRRCGPSFGTRAKRR